MIWAMGAELVIHQLLCGRDIAVDQANPLFVAAGQMANYVYIIECKSSQNALLIDACWDVTSVYKYAELHKLAIVGAVYTHRHFDHVSDAVLLCV
jgi:glyoxylase-like metal-dependent hydrolase (beta-lactamase superfamily II)